MCTGLLTLWASQLAFAEQAAVDPAVLAKLAGTYVGELQPAAGKADRFPPGRRLIITPAGEGRYGTLEETPYPVPLAIMTEGTAIHVSFTTSVGSEVRLTMQGDSLVGVLTIRGFGTGRNIKLTKQP